MEEERGGKTRLTALTPLHISSYLYDQWGGGRGWAGWNPGAELTATPVLFSSLRVSFIVPASLAHLPLPGSAGLRLFICLSHVHSLSYPVPYGPYPSWSLSLSPSFSPHGSIQPPWLPPASLPQRLSPNPWKFGTNELTAEPLPRSLVPNYTVLHTRFPLQMAWCYSRHCGEHSSCTSTCPQMHTK